VIQILLLVWLCYYEFTTTTSLAFGIPLFGDKVRIWGMSNSHSAMGDM